MGFDRSASVRDKLDVVQVGSHRVAKPRKGKKSFFSAASACAYVRDKEVLISVSDDQDSVFMSTLNPIEFRRAVWQRLTSDLVPPGITRRIMSGVLPDEDGPEVDENEIKERKADFESCFYVSADIIATIDDDDLREEMLDIFPFGLIFIAGSGGKSWKGVRRSIGVARPLNQHGRVMGLASELSLEDLHCYLDENVVKGELNIEGMTYHNGEVILVHRGNNDQKDGTPAANMLIRLDFAEFMRSIVHDMKIGKLELIAEPLEYDLGTVDVVIDGVTHKVKLCFTDIDAINGDPEGRLVFTAAAEAPGNRIGGSIVGIMDSKFRIIKEYVVTDSSLKIEGIDAFWDDDEQQAELVMVTDADDPNLVAGIYGATVRV